MDSCVCMCGWESTRSKVFSLVKVDLFFVVALYLHPIRTSHTVYVDIIIVENNGIENLVHFYVF